MPRRKLISGADAENEQSNIGKVVSAFPQDLEPLKPHIEDDIARLMSGRLLTYRNPHYDEEDGPDEPGSSVA